MLWRRKKKTRSGVIASIGGFDQTYYRLKNPDVAASGVDLLDHFLNHGWKEGRDPSRHFSVSGYLQANPDVAAANINPLVHFWAFGLAEGRSGWQVAEAATAFQEGRYKDALSASNRIAETSPGLPGAYYWGSLAGIYDGDFRGVCDLGMRAIKNGIAEPLVLTALGTAFWRLDLPDFALIAHERAFKLDPGSSHVRLGLARACIRMGDLQRAIDVAGPMGDHLAPDRSTSFELTTAEELALSNLTWPFGIYQAGISAFRREDWDTAVHHFSRAFHLFLTQQNVNMIDICGEYYCNAKICSENKSGLRAISDAASPFLPDARWPKVYAGAQDLLEGRTDDGLRKIVEAQPLPPRELGDLLGLNSLLLPEAVTLSRRERSPRLSSGAVSDFRAAQARVGSGRAILAACDGTYFSKLSNLYVGSLNIVAPGSHLHFHIMNPLDSTEALIGHLRTRYRDVEISFSRENIDKSDKNLKAIYATRRFEVAFELIQKLSVNLLVTDVDISFESPVADFISKLRGSDVGLMFEGRVLPWFSNPATIAFFSNTPSSLKFLSYVNSYVALAFASLRDTNIWFVDQNALYVSRQIMGSSLQIANLNSIEPGIFGCYTTEGRDLYTERRSRELGLSDPDGAPETVTAAARAGGGRL
ncbi:hypothetical protein M446_3984 [Methylobacterium sp. 4-46]|uniref:tetratricopeptide repeat protein n=1 Tax=unclassified Methylobacterium TaxID=2615210 RepID=UPI000152BEF5|nr:MULTISPECIES: hypothetical protein [Methylobacterium]ACA18349.1 hypothetical protein M446_3984 [Methylobacterium sp. 4-46]WFT77646.1 hypothetical protein QA634_20245 [Methylobacterium nodulans]